MAELEINDPSPIIVRKSEVDRQAEEIKAKRALPPKPGDRVSFHELKQWLNLLPEGAEDRVTIWVYRMEPIINRQLVDPQANNNIDVIYTSFASLNEEYMIDRHGGGTYKFVVKDEDKPKVQLGGFFEARLVIDMVQHTPKLDLREVEWDNPKNKGFKNWCRAKRMINETNMPIIEKVGETEQKTNGVDASMLKMLLDFTAKMSEKEQIQLKKQIGGEDAANKSMNELFLEKLKQEDPNKQMTMIIGLVTAMKSMIPEQKPDNTLATIMPMFMTMMSQMNEAANRQMTMMVELMKSKNEPAEGKGDKISELRAIIDLAKEIKGNPGGSNHERSTAEVVTDFLAPIVAPALTIVGNIMAMNAQAKGVSVTPAPMTATDVINAESNKQGMNNQSVNQPLAIPANEAANIIANYGPLILNKLAGDGWEFGASIADLFGDAAAAGIVKYGPEGLLQAAKSVPQFWQQVESTYGEEHLKKWLASLCNYKEIMKQMDEEEELPNAIREIK